MNPPPTELDKPSEPVSCARCFKTRALCVCEKISPHETRVEILLLQHPQEPDKELGSARLAHLALPQSKLKVGLSWRNLEAAVGHPAKNSEWAVLYLGSGIKAVPPLSPTRRKSGLHFVDKKGAPAQIDSSEIRGLVLLDGTWSQAKTLWWRNAWLLKLRRAVLIPREKSLYRELRKEPREECLSSIESLAECLTGLGEPQTIETALKEVFASLLEKQRARLKVRRQRS